MEPDQEIRQLKRQITEQNRKISSLNRRDAEKANQIRGLEKEIADLKDENRDQAYHIKKIDDKLTEISGDTTFIRQKFTGALIVAAVGGVIGMFFFVVQYLLTN